MKILKLNTRVSTKVNGQYEIGHVVARHPGDHPDNHRYDVRKEGGRKIFPRQFVYPTTVTRENWEEIA
jgi:hypothetical protein